MDFTICDKQKQWRDRIAIFMAQHVYPAVPTHTEQMNVAPEKRWRIIPVLEELKQTAKAEGLWKLFLPPSAHDTPEYKGAGLTNLEYALCAEEMGKVAFGSEVFNCSAPDTGNMEVLHRYATTKQKDQWLRPLMAGEIRSAFLMTEPDVASSDATNIETDIRRDGEHYVVNGRKWWVLWRGRSALQGSDRHGQDQQASRKAPATVPDPRAARCQGHQGRAHAARLWL
jgi:acyl-CoA dehydrogenase